MLKKIIATGAAAAGLTGAVLLAGSADAQAGVEQAGHPIAACYSVSPYVAQPAYCVQPGYPYPGHHYGWGRWHHHDWWHGWPHHRYYR